MSFSLLVPFDSQIVIGVTIAYAVTSSITTFDLRLSQSKKNGTLPVTEPELPKWVNFLYWLEWVFLATLVYLNWKYALIVYAIKFALMVLPVLESLGNILMSPFKKRKK
jgi:hypothetical protein